VDDTHLPRASISYFDEATFDAFVTSLPSESKSAVAAAMETVLTEGLFLLDTNWLKAITPPLLELRIGPTLGAVLARVGLADHEWHRQAALLVRVFIVFDGPSRIVVLHAYDKTLDRERDSQQAQIAIAQKNLLTWMSNRDA
jgi:hypothetical protein